MGRKDNGAVPVEAQVESRIFYGGWIRTCRVVRDRLSEEFRKKTLRLVF